MNYFINTNFAAELDDITLSELQRYHAFNAHGYPIKFLTLAYDNAGILQCSQHQLAVTDVINMYDFWQQVPSTLKILPGHPTAFEIGFAKDMTIVPIDGVSHVMKDGFELATIYFFAGTEQVQQVDFLDQYSHLVQSDFYDARGFKSRTLYYDLQGNLSHAITYNLKGQQVVHEMYDHTHHNTLLTLYYQHQEYTFDNYDGAFQFFLQQILQPQDVVIAEEPATYQYLLNNNLSTIKQYVSLPIHVVDMQQPAQSALTPAMQELMQAPPQKLNAGIVATAQQQSDLEQWCHVHQQTLPFPLKVASFATAATKQQIPMVQRKPLNFVSFMSMLPSRHPLLILRAFNQFVEQNHYQAHLTLYGYGDEALIKQCEKYIQDETLTEQVTLAAYGPRDWETVLDQSVGLIDLADDDPQSVAMVTALAHGVPMIVGHGKYGFQELVQDGVNGWVVDLEINSIVQAFNHFTQPDVLQQASTNAYYLAQEYQPAAVTQEWSSILTANATSKSN